MQEYAIYIWPSYAIALVGLGLLWGFSWAAFKKQQNNNHDT